MSHHDSDDLQALAGEYVLGTLSAVQRRAVQERMAYDTDLRAAINDWETRLLPLTALSEPVAPSSRLWGRIRRSVDAQVADAAARRQPVSRTSSWLGVWYSLSLWRGLAVAGFASAIVLSAMLANRIATPPQVQYMVVLTAPQDKAPGWVVQASSPRQISLIPLAVVEVPEGRALEFWTKGDGWNAPVSLGLIQPGQTLQVSLDKLPPLQPNQLFELTLEPVTGSPTGRPTGPVQYIGRAVKVM